MLRTELDVIDFAQLLSINRNLYVGDRLGELAGQNVVQVGGLKTNNDEGRVHEAECSSEFWNCEDCPRSEMAFRAREGTIDGKCDL